jgi:hypothetical protein
MVQNQFVKMVKVGLSFTLGLMVLSVSGQSDCRSIFGTGFKPVNSTPLSWGVELTGAGALMNDRYTANWSAYGGVDYFRKKHQIYFEGAYKGWYNSAGNPEGRKPQSDFPAYNRPTPSHFGLRELFYRIGDRDSYIKAGVQSFISGDYMLFDERMLGVSGLKSWGGLQFSAAFGTVTQHIARFQDVCGNRHIYNIIHRSQFNFVGDQPGESNFTGAFLKWTPSSLITETAESTDDFYEFEAFKEFTNTIARFGSTTHGSNRQFFSVYEAGMFAYQEFGSGFHQYKYYGGLFSTFFLPFQLSLKTQLTGQYILDDRTLAFYFGLDRPFYWDQGGVSRFVFSYLTKFDIDDKTHFYPAFSNLFLGEVMRLDAIDLPIITVAFKHQFENRLKPSLQLQYAGQLKGSQSRETD